VAAVSVKISSISQMVVVWGPWYYCKQVYWPSYQHHEHEKYLVRVRCCRGC